MPMFDYRVQFEVFEGPLDLLLHLIKKEEVSIYEINLTKIATEFIDYIEMMRQLDLVVAGDFLVMASTLMYIKSRELLPADKQAVMQEEDEDDASPKWELIRQLVEYKKFKEAAGRLQRLEDRRDKVFARHPGKMELPPPASATPQASVFSLVKAVNKVLERYQERLESREILEDPWTVSEKIEYLTRLIRERKQVRFFELFDHATTRSEVVVTFLALLEIIRMWVAVAYQPTPFGEIEIHHNEGETTESPERAASPLAAESETPEPSQSSSSEAQPWN